VAESAAAFSQALSDDAAPEDRARAAAMAEDILAAAALIAAIEATERAQQAATANDATLQSDPADTPADGQTVVAADSTDAAEGQLADIASAGTLSSVDAITFAGTASN